MTMMKFRRFLAAVLCLVPTLALAGGASLPPFGANSPVTINGVQTTLGRVAPQALPSVAQRTPGASDDIASGYYPGSITGLVVNNPGAGCTSVTVTLPAPPAGGTQATAIANVSGGAVQSYTVTNPGRGYLTAVTATVTGTGCTTAPSVLYVYGSQSLWNTGNYVYTNLANGSGAATWSATGALGIGLPGDAVGVGLQAAYGTRRIVQAYGTGPAIDVQYANGGTTTTVSYRADGTIDYPTLDAATLKAGGASPRVVKLYDQSGAGNHATAPAYANAPTIVPSNLCGTRGDRSLVFDSVINGGSQTQVYLTVPNAVASTGNNNGMLGVWSAFSSGSRISSFAQWSNASAPQNFSSGKYAEQPAFTYGSPYTAPVRPHTTMTTGGWISGSSIIVAWDEYMTARGGQGSFAIAGGFIGNITSAAGASQGTGYMETCMATFLSTAPTSAQYHAWRTAAVNTFGLTPQARASIVVTGDSISEGFGSINLQNWPNQLKSLLTRPALIYNRATFGSTFSTQASSYSTIIAPIAAQLPVGSPKYNLVMLGRNDLNTQTDANLISSLQSYMAQAVTGGWAGIYIGTVLPATAFNATQETYRQNYNAFVRANFRQLGAAGIIDYAADPVLGSPTAAANAALLVDGTHPTTLGYSYMAGDAAAVVNQVLQ